MASHSKYVVYVFLIFLEEMHWLDFIDVILMRSSSNATLDEREVIVAHAFMCGCLLYTVSHICSGVGIYVFQRMNRPMLLLYAYILRTMLYVATPNSYTLWKILLYMLSAQEYFLTELLHPFHCYSRTLDLFAKTFGSFAAILCRRAAMQFPYNLVADRDVHPNPMYPSGLYLMGLSMFGLMFLREIVCSGECGNVDCCGDHDVASKDPIDVESNTSISNDALSDSPSISLCCCKPVDIPLSSSTLLSPKLDEEQEEEHAGVLKMIAARPQLEATIRAEAASTRKQDEQIDVAYCACSGPQCWQSCRWPVARSIVSAGTRKALPVRFRVTFDRIIWLGYASFNYASSHLCFLSVLLYSSVLRNTITIDLPSFLDKTYVSIPEEFHKGFFTVTSVDVLLPIYYFAALLCNLFVTVQIIPPESTRRFRAVNRLITFVLFVCSIAIFCLVLKTMPNFNAHVLLFVLLAAFELARSTYPYPYLYRKCYDKLFLSVVNTLSLLGLCLFIAAFHYLLNFAILSAVPVCVGVGYIMFFVVMCIRC